MPAFLNPFSGELVAFPDELESLSFTKSIDLPPTRTYPTTAVDTNSGLWDNTYYELAVDPQNRIGYGLRRDGTFEVGKFLASTATIGTLNVETIITSSLTGDTNAVQSSAGDVFTVETSSSSFHIYRYALSGGRTQLTTTGQNYNISLTAEATQRLTFFSTGRFTSGALEVMSLDGTRRALVIPTRDIVVWGDSMTAYLQQDGNLPALLPGRTISFRGVGSQTSVQIAARQGGIVATGTIAGNTIPASGAVSVSGLYPSPVTQLGGNSTFIVTATNGTEINGTLAWNGGSPTFTRATAGSAVAVPDPASFVPSFGPTINGILYSFNEQTALLWSGRNGVGGSFGETDVSVYNAMIANIRNVHKRYLILSIFNASGEGTGTTAYSTIIARNNAIQAAFPSNYYDLRTAFVAGAKAWLQTNYNSYFTSNWGASDTDIANDIPPAAMRLDGIHLNSYGSLYASSLINSQITSRGW
jgi:hypothetical protein